MWTKGVYLGGIISIVPNYTITSVLSVCIVFWKHDAPPTFPLCSLMAPHVILASPALVTRWIRPLDTTGTSLLILSLLGFHPAPLMLQGRWLYKQVLYARVLLIVTQKASRGVSACPRNASVWVLLETLQVEADVVYFALPSVCLSWRPSGLRNCEATPRMLHLFLALWIEAGCLIWGTVINVTWQEF